MRWLFLSLVLLNIGYIAWELNHERSHQAVTAAVPKGVERIVLLRELDTGTSAQQDSSPASATDIAKKAEDVSVQKDAARPQPSTEKPAVKLTETAPNRVAALDAGYSGDDDAAPDNSQAVAAVEVPDTVPAGDLCYTLGPFREMKTLRKVTREIKDYVVEASFRSKEEQEQTMFRVIIKPIGSKQEAEAMIRKLVSKNIRDHFIITEGPDKNAISLGYFSEKNRAYRHAERIRKLGFDAVAEPVFRSYTIFWLDYRIEAGSEIPQRIFDQHLENTAQRLSRVCG